NTCGVGYYRKRSAEFPTPQSLSHWIPSNLHETALYNKYLRIFNLIDMIYNVSLAITHFSEKSWNLNFVNHSYYVGTTANHNFTNIF
uniref:hypothetical protein n=1 Tax=Leptospira interrogans TaxID=173 RepID=UPI001B8B0411